MECVIGMDRRDVVLRPLVERRIPLRNALDGSIRIQKEVGQYIWVTLQGSEQVLILAEILADILVEILQIKFLMRELRMVYEIASQKEQCELLVETVKRLWKQEGEKGVERQKEALSRRIAKYLLEESRLLCLDGFLYFRMQDCLACWRETLEQVVKEHLLRREQKEFIKLLRCLVSMKDPGVEYVCIRAEAEEYTLWDRKGRQICMEDFLWEEGSTKEDRLISRLVELCPEVIRLEGVEDEVLVRLIREIFVGRVRRVSEQTGR